LDRLMRGSKLTLVVACRDRLTRFGFELIQYMVEQNGGSIVVLDQPVHCPESELTADLLAIIHVFSCRMHGLRKYGKKIKEDPSLPNPVSTDDD
jgi:putative resolvase